MILVQNTVRARTQCGDSGRHQPHLRSTAGAQTDVELLAAAFCGVLPKQTLREVFRTISGPLCSERSQAHCAQDDWAQNAWFTLHYAMVLCPSLCSRSMVLCVLVLLLYALVTSLHCLHCIDFELHSELYGPHCSTAKAPAQERIGPFQAPSTQKLASMLDQAGRGRSAHA